MHHVLLNVLYDISNLIVIRDCRKACFWAKRTEIGEKSQTIGKSYFLYVFPFSTNVTECSMYSTVPCLTYQTCKSQEVAKLYSLGQNIEKLK